ncbi:MAG: sulfatase-like hydrolase/transferase, partial [Proteobacteria bacterium]|nr:sulfatase-like hydrolase/transferase [Pseudomonadota bacterium]
DRAGTSQRGLYGDVVEEIDWSVGEIVAALERIGLAENTLVIFTSDNGPWGWAGLNGGSAGLLRGKKGSPWEGGFRGPAIVWMPGTVPANVTSDALGTTMDLLPTFLNMAGADASGYSSLDGIDITETFLEIRAVRDRVIYYRQEDFVAYRHGAWKLFVNNPNPWSDEFQDSDLPLLYNLEVDPSEAFNVAEDNPEVVARITALAAAHEDSVERVPSQLIGILPEFQEEYDRYHNNQ